MRQRCQQTSQGFCCCRCQTLAGLGLHDHVRHCEAGHAEAARGHVVGPAQLPPRPGLVQRRPGPRPLEAEDHSAQTPEVRGEWMEPGEGYFATT